MSWFPSPSDFSNLQSPESALPLEPTELIPSPHLFQSLGQPSPEAVAAAATRAASTPASGSKRAAEPTAATAPPSAPARPELLALRPKLTHFKHAHAYFGRWHPGALENFVVAHTLSAPPLRTPGGPVDFFQTAVWHAATHPLAFPEAVAAPVAQGAPSKKARRSSWVPKAIHEVKTEKKVEYFRVEWEGSTEHTWEPRGNLGPTGDALIEAWKKSISSGAV